MLQIDIVPLSRIKIQNIGEVYLDQNRKAVENHIGLSDTSDTVSIDNITTYRAFYEAYELRIDYDSSDMVEFIEFIHGPYPEKTELRIYGSDPFRVEAKKLLEILSDNNSGKINYSEAPYSYAFENISVGIWRDSTPSGVQQLINEKKTNHTYEVDKSWLDEELEKSNHFWTIGIGRKDYYKS